MTDVIAGGGQIPQSAERFEALYELHARRVSAYIAAFLSRTYRRTDPDLVQDLAQDTWEQVWRSLASYDTTRPAMPWLTTIARRAVIRHFRVRRNHERPTDMESAILPFSRSAEDESIAVATLVRMLQEPPGTPLGVAA